MKRAILGIGAVAVWAVLFVWSVTRSVDVVQAQGAASYFVCNVSAVSAATQCQATAAAGKRLVITDYVLINNVGTAQTIKLVSGTGTNCASGTADVTIPVQFAAAVGNFAMNLHSPIYLPVATALCITPSAATSISGTIVGFTE